MIAAGCDPGLTSGGLVILDTAARRVLLSYEWRPMAKRKADPEATIEHRLTVDGALTVERIPRSAHVGSCGAWLAAQPAWPAAVARVEVCAVEGVGYYGPGHGRSQADARAASAMWREWLIGQTGKVPAVVMPHEWRRMLPKGGRTSGALDRRASLWCDLTLPGHGLTTAGGWDAACMGWWAWHRR